MQRRNLAFLLPAFAVLALAGCAGRELQRSEGFTRPAASASTRFYVPASINVKISRASYGSYVPPTIGPGDRARAQKELRDMFEQIERQLQARLQESGVPRGDDLVLALDVEEGFHTNHGPGAIVNVRALFKGTPAGTPVWSFKFQAFSSLVDDPQKTAAKFADKVMHEVQTAGMLPAAGKR